MFTLALTFLKPVLSFFTGIWSFLLNNKTLLYIVIAVSVIGFGYYKYTSKVKEISSLSIQVDALELSLKSKEDIIKQLETNRKEIVIIRKEVSKSKGLINTRKQELLRGIESSKIDSIAIHDTKKLEEQINNDSKKFKKCIEAATGNKSSKCS
jgi:hypothetical protein